MTTRRELQEQLIKEFDQFLDDLYEKYPEEIQSSNVGRFKREVMDKMALRVVTDLMDFMRIGRHRYVKYADPDRPNLGDEQYNPQHYFDTIFPLKLEFIDPEDEMPEEYPMDLDHSVNEDIIDMINEKLLKYNIDLANAPNPNAEDFTAYDMIERIISNIQYHARAI